MKIKQYWEKFAGKVDGLSLRERVLIFAAVVFVLVALIRVLSLDPLLAQQKKMSAQVVQQQEKMKQIQAQIADLIKAKKDDENSPLRERLDKLQQQIVDGEAYLQSRRDRLVTPEKMAELLEQVLKKNGHLQLMSLQALPAALVLDKTAKPVVNASAVSGVAAQDKRLFKHGVQITVRGSYLDLLQYLTELEHLQSQMFWGMAKMNALQYPAVELTLTVYTLSLDKIWLQI
jgi:MSHA biogenesis protein MshJ